MAADYALDPKLDMDGAVALHAALCHVEDNIKINGAAVEICGAAAAQVLVSLARALKSSGYSLTLEFQSESLRADLTALGLEGYFKGEHNG